MQADTYEGPHLQICKCGLPLHYHLLDESDREICPIPLLTQGMVREAIAKYGDGWNSTIHAHLEGNLAASGLPERLEGMEYQSLDDALAQYEQSRHLREQIIAQMFVVGVEINESGVPTGNGFIAVAIGDDEHGEQTDLDNGHFYA